MANSEKHFLERVITAYIWKSQVYLELTYFENLTLNRAFQVLCCCTFSTYSYLKSCTFAKEWRGATWFAVHHKVYIWAWVNLISLLCITLAAVHIHWYLTLLPSWFCDYFAVCFCAQKIPRNFIPYIMLSLDCFCKNCRCEILFMNEVHFSTECLSGGFACFVE